MASSRRMSRRLTVGWVIFSRAAARLKLAGADDFEEDAEIVPIHAVRQGLFGHFRIR